MKSSYCLAAGSFFCAGTLLLTLPAQAFGGDHANGVTDRSGTFRSLHHGSGTYSSTVDRQPGSASGSTTWSNRNGEGDHTFDNTYTNTGAGTGTGTHDSSTTYANGTSSSSQGTFTKTAPGESTYSAIHTGATGNVTDINKTTTTRDGTRTVDTIYDNTTTGKTASVDKSYSIDADGSKQFDTSVTGPNGKTATDDKTLSTNSNGSKQLDTAITGPNGKTIASDQTFTKNGTGYTQTGTVTGPNGKTSTDNRDVTFTKDANGEVTRTATGSITGPNGGTKLIGNTETMDKTYTPNPAPTSTPPSPVD